MIGKTVHLFNSNRLHSLKELEIDVIIHSKDWIFGAAVDSGFEILYKPFWWTEGYNYGQKWTYKFDVNDLHFDPNGLTGTIVPYAEDNIVNFADSFNPVTQIMFGLPEKSEVQLVVYDLLGREIVTLKSGVADPGWFIIQWEGINNSSKKVPSGIYIYTLTAASLESDKTFAETKKIVLLK